MLVKCEAVHHGYCAPLISSPQRKLTPPVGISRHRTTLGTLGTPKPKKPKLHILRQVCEEYVDGMGGGGIGDGGRW